MAAHKGEITLVVAVNANTSKINMRPANMNLKYGSVGVKR